MRARPATALVAAVLLASAALAGVGDVRTLVVRGRVLAAGGSPVAGARVSARGGASISAVSDDRGHYTLSVPIGSVAGLRRGPFALEVRAELAGRRLAFGSGASALSLEVSLVSGNVVRVRSNSAEATTSLASAFAIDGFGTAWVDADFGGSSRPSGALEMRWSSDVRLDGGPAPALRESPRATEPDHATRVDTLPRTPIVETPRGTVRRDSVVRVQRLAREAAKRQAAAEKARRDSTRAAQVGIERASRESRRIAFASGAAAAARDSTSRAPGPATASHGGPPSPRETTRVVSAPPVAPNEPRVVSASSSAAETPDTCACRLRGTVEIDWDRPLDRNFPVELTLEGPALQSTQVDMFMGSPREFRFGPLPCGDYRLTVATSGRWHFTFERGDTVLAVPCRGSAQKRVILVPSKR